MVPKLEIIKRGACFTVYALIFGDSHDVSTFLIDLEKSNPSEHSRMVRRLEQIADRGAIFDRRKYNPLRNGLIEAKTDEGTRVIFFYEKGKVVLCTSAFIKKRRKTPPEELERAEHRREAFHRALKCGSISI